MMKMICYSYSHPLLLLTVYPLKTLITTLQRPLTADRKIRMTCKTSGSKPPAVIRWFKENEQLKKVKQTEDNGTTVSVLTFTPTASDNGDRLRCVAINPTMPGRKVEDSRQLNIFCKLNSFFQIPIPPSSTFSRFTHFLETIYEKLI